jgi:hypothetical protein
MSSDRRTQTEMQVDLVRELRELADRHEALAARLAELVNQLRGIR